jgi:hypothetical protein
VGSGDAHLDAREQLNASARHAGRQARPTARPPVKALAAERTRGRSAEVPTEQPPPATLSKGVHRRHHYQPRQAVDRGGATPSDLSTDLSSDLPPG